MGRQPKFTAEQIVDTAEGIVAAHGPSAATVTRISERLEAPSGSIYHRFASRDLILAHLWLRTVRRAQSGFIEALSDGTLDSAIKAALHVPRWSREHLAPAKILVLYRRSDLAKQWPDELGADLTQLNDGVVAALRHFTEQRYGAARRELLERVTFALVDIPYAAVRRHLVAGAAPLPSVDALVREAVTALLSTPSS